MRKFRELKGYVVLGGLATLSFCGCGSSSDAIDGSGGTSGFGGAVGNGGNANIGGNANTGGSIINSGQSTTGGSIGNGGMVNTGGARTATTGGTKATTDTTTVGGSPTTGGNGSTGGAMTGGTKATGGVNTGGNPATGGKSATGGTSSSSGGASSTGVGGGTFGPNSVAYIGCSMANNIGNGYKRVGGKVMWNSDNYQTGAMVVQNWTSTTSSSWSLFDTKMNSIGGKDKVKAVMVQICIFSSRATDDEIKSMIKAAKSHTNPGTHIYLVGQPQYEAGHECTLAGNGGAQWTDDEAKKIAADPSINQDVSYLGQFVLNSTKSEVMSDTCHATTTGEDVLGKQAMTFFGG